jgi:hypothetical protein
MRTHFPGTLHEVRLAALFPLSVAGALIPNEWRASAKRGLRLSESESQMGFCIFVAKFLG